METVLIDIKDLWTFTKRKSDVLVSVFLNKFNVVEFSF